MPGGRGVAMAAGVRRGGAARGGVDRGRAVRRRRADRLAGRDRGGLADAARARAAAVQRRRLQLPRAGHDPAPRPQPVHHRSCGARRLWAGPRAVGGVAVLAPHDIPLRPPVPGADERRRLDHGLAPDRRRARNAGAGAGRRRPARDLRPAAGARARCRSRTGHVARRAQPAARARADRRRPQRRADDRPAGRRRHGRAPGPSRTRRRGLRAGGDGQAAGARGRAVHRRRLGALRARPLPGGSSCWRNRRSRRSACSRRQHRHRARASAG